MTIISRSLEWKKMLAFVRGGDYTHAGEEDAIKLVMAKVTKNENQRILDVACGLGGTANFVQCHQYGKVTGIDIDEESINYAKKAYPSVRFHCLDAHFIERLEEQFDLLYIFNVFYEFDDQVKVLQGLHKVASANALFIIFDYLDFSGGTSPIFKKRKTTIPINPSTFGNVLAEGGWILKEFSDISFLYEQWYNELVEKLYHYEMEIKRKYGKEGFDKFINTYTTWFDEIRTGRIGGGIFFIKRSAAHYDENR